jgi:tellurite resistance protein
VADKEFLGDRRRTQEEEYFQRREQELIAKLQRRGREEETRRRLAERTGVADQKILRDLETLGYTPETVMLLHLVPLLQVAWAEGRVSDREQALIIEVARARGIEAGSAADSQLATWLATRPSADFFEGTLRAIGAILQARPPEEREASRRDLLSCCTAIASASGGIVGLGKMSPQERKVLARISQELEHTRDPDARPSGGPLEGRP